MLWSLCVIVAFASVPSDAQITSRYVIGCPARCDKSMCPRVTADCPAGQALDACHCCLVCASGENEACGGSGKLGDPVCGEGLECSVPGGVAYTVTVRRRSKSGTCVCKTTDPVCGSDGVSYRNICELKRVSRRAQKLQQPPVLFIQRGACGKGKVVMVVRVGSRTKDNVDVRVLTVMVIELYFANFLLSLTVVKPQ